MDITLAFYSLQLSISPSFIYTFVCFNTPIVKMFWAVTVSD